MPEAKTPFRIRPLTMGFLAAAAVFLVVAVVYFAASHPKHGALFLAVGSLIGAWFSTGEARIR